MFQGFFLPKQFFFGGGGMLDECFSLRRKFDF